MDTNQPTDAHEPEANVYAGVYHVLLGGMVLSCLFFAVGLVRGMMLHTFFPLTPEWIQGHYHWHALVEGLRTLDPTVLMMIATVLLILTPVARVVVSIIAFAADGDRKYVLVTSAVLAVMLLTFVLSRFGLQ